MALQRQVLLLCALLMFSLPVSGANELAPSKRNVVLIVVDDLGWSDLTCYGADLHETPHLDRFASQAVRFTHAYAASPVCSPTRASIMTGKYPARLHMTVWRERAVAGPVTRQGLRTPPSIPDLPHSEITLAERFHQAGYFTAHIGKWHLGGATSYPETHGFDVNVGGTLWGAPPTYFYPYRGPFGVRKAFRYVPRLEWGRPGEYLTDRLTDEAIAIIRRVKDRPFLVYLAYHTVHTPIEPKPELADRFRQKMQPQFKHRNADYAAMVASLDANFGRLMGELRKLGCYDNTAVIVVSDNGGYINEYRGRRVTNNYPLRSGKGSLYEGGIRVPLLIRVPGTAAGVCSTPVITNDLYPTCLAIAGITEGDRAVEQDGLSLVPLLDNPAGKLNRDALYFHYPHFYMTTTPVSAIRHGKYKLLHYYLDGHDELYDLADDASERRDLASSQPALVRELRNRLDGWLRSVAARRPTPVQR